MTNEQKRQYLNDALDDLIKVLKTFNDAYNNMCEWYEAYGETNLLRGSNMEFKHDLYDENVDWFSASDIFSTVLDTYEEDVPDKKEWPNEFTPNYSYCEMPNSAMAISEMRDRIMAKLYKKFSTDIEANNRFTGLDLD